MEIVKALQKYETKDTQNYVWENTVLKTGSRWTLQQGVQRMQQHCQETTAILNKLLQQGKLKEDFSIVELFCGDAAVLYYLKKQFPKCKPLGLDLLYHSTWDTIKTQQPDQQFSQADFFKLYHDGFKFDLDVMITFNTYRGWNNDVGPLRHFNMNLEQFEGWARESFSYIVVDGVNGAKAQLL